MKKSIYISGIFTTNLLLIGCIFKINHWPGAGVALTLSLLFLSFWFLPTALLHHYKRNDHKHKKWLYITAFISFFIMFIAALFKIQHWTGASFLLMIAIPIPFVLFLPVYIYHSAKDKQQSSLYFTAVILGLIFIAVYSGLLNLNVSKNVLDHGVLLIKSNEKTIDYYENNIKSAITAKSSSTSNIDDIISKSDLICSTIHSAKQDLLKFTENSHLSTDFGQHDFFVNNINNMDSRNAVHYILFWKDDATIPKLYEEMVAYKSFLTSLELKDETKKAIQLMYNLEDAELHGERYPWTEREFSSDYLIFALESLSRWEKNVRFTENLIIQELVNKSEDNTIL
ncbi:MAG: hypothetical protein KQH79_17870 [Bacteroidetes bacterium]|nr:hypothetical protein [Bacteroidota bacterium]